MSVNLPTACPRTLKIGGIQRGENKSIKAQYPKCIERKRLVKDFEVNLILSLYRGKAIQRMAQSLAFHSCVMSVSYLLFFSLTIRELLLSKDGLSQVVAHHLEILGAKLTKSIGNKEFAMKF